MRFLGALARFVAAVLLVLGLTLVSALPAYASSSGDDAAASSQTKDQEQSLLDILLGLITGTSNGTEDNRAGWDPDN